MTNKQFSLFNTSKTKFTVRVTALETFRKYVEQDVLYWKSDEPVKMNKEECLAMITGQLIKPELTYAANIGTTIHNLLEWSYKAKNPDVLTTPIMVDGQSFKMLGGVELFEDFCKVLNDRPVAPEVRREINICDNIYLTGQCDYLTPGGEILDVKTTRRTDMAKYYNSLQSYGYMEIFDAHKFTYIVIEIDYPDFDTAKPDGTIKYKKTTTLNVDSEGSRLVYFTNLLREFKHFCYFYNVEHKFLS